jgi:hypothetical protein
MIPVSPDRDFQAKSWLVHSQKVRNNMDYDRHVIRIPNDYEVIYSTIHAKPMMSSRSERPEIDALLCFEAAKFLRNI